MRIDPEGEGWIRTEKVAALLAMLAAPLRPSEIYTEAQVDANEEQTEAPTPTRFAKHSASTHVFARQLNESFADELIQEAIHRGDLPHRVKHGYIDYQDLLGLLIWHSFTSYSQYIPPPPELQTEQTKSSPKLRRPSLQDRRSTDKALQRLSMAPVNGRPGCVSQDYGHEKSTDDLREVLKASSDKPSMQLRTLTELMQLQVMWRGLSLTE